MCLLLPSFWKRSPSPLGSSLIVQTQAHVDIPGGEHFGGSHPGVTDRAHGARPPNVDSSDSRLWHRPHAAVSPRKMAGTAPHEGRERSSGALSSRSRCTATRPEEDSAGGPGVTNDTGSTPTAGLSLTSHRGSGQSRLITR